MAQLQSSIILNTVQTLVTGAAGSTVNPHEVSIPIPHPQPGAVIGIVQSLTRIHVHYLGASAVSDQFATVTHHIGRQRQSQFNMDLLRASDGIPIGGISWNVDQGQLVEEHTTSPDYFLLTGADSLVAVVKAFSGYDGETAEASFFASIRWAPVNADLSLGPQPPPLPPRVVQIENTGAIGGNNNRVAMVVLRSDGAMFSAIRDFSTTPPTVSGWTLITPIST